MASVGTKYRRIYEAVRDAIASGEYGVGQRVPSETELGQRFGVCRQTASQALRELENQGLVVRRRGAGTFVTQRSSARQCTWGLLVPEAHGGIFATMSGPMTRAARGQGYSILFDDPYDPSGEPDRLMRRASELCQEYVSRNVSGVFFMPLVVPPDQSGINVHVVESFRRVGIPVVLLDRDIYDYPRRSGFDLVGVANRRSSQLLAEHLLGLGRRRIGYVTHPGYASTVTARIHGYRDALREYGMDASDYWVHADDFRTLNGLPGFVQQTSVDALMCVNDQMAASVVRKLTTTGFRVPDDVAVVGFDDVDYADLVLVPLTTMRQPCAKIGEMAVRMMQERLAEPDLPPREIAFDCELVIRGSCGAARHLES